MSCIIFKNKIPRLKVLTIMYKDPLGAGGE